MPSADFDRLITRAGQARRMDDPKRAIEELSKVLEELLAALKEQERARERAQRP